MNEILTRKVVFSTPWFEVVEKTLVGWNAPYYALNASDYVSVLATTVSGGLLLVRQYRPAVEGFTVELPSGHVEPGESAEDAARRELLEETGHEAGELSLLANLIPDSGRLGMRQWCYWAKEARLADIVVEREQGLELLEWDVSELLAYIREAKFNHALHLAAVLLWIMREPHVQAVMGTLNHSG